MFLFVRIALTMAMRFISNNIRPSIWTIQIKLTPWVSPRKVIISKLFCSGKTLIGRKKWNICTQLSLVFVPSYFFMSGIPSNFVSARPSEPPSAVAPLSRVNAWRPNYADYAASRPTLGAVSSSSWNRWTALRLVDPLSLTPSLLSLSALLAWSRTLQKEL